MFKTLITAAFVLTAVAAPVLAEDAKPHGFGQSVENALSYLTINKAPQASTRDAQIGEGAFDDYATARANSNSQRGRVFAQGDPATSAAPSGYRGFGSQGFGRIDR